MKRKPQSNISVEQRGRAAVAEVKGSTHRFYEDRSCMLSVEAPLVRDAGRGEIFAVFDGVGGAPMGMRAAQAMTNALIDFFETPDRWRDSPGGMEELIRSASREIHDWGMIEGTDRPLGAAAGTIVWMYDGDAVLFHAGDTEAWLGGPEGCRPVLPETPAGDAVVQYFGRGRDLDLAMPEIWEGDGDRLLLFSDGLRKCVYPSAIKKALASSSPKEEIVRDLVDQAVRVGAPDDVTVMLIDLVDR